MNPHPIYSKDATVYLVTGENKVIALRSAIEQSGFVSNLMDWWQKSGKSKDEFKISIKPNIMTAAMREADSPTYTDPLLVEELIRVMRRQGFAQFAVVEAENVYNYSYEGRRVGAVAELVGYTQDGYTVHSLTEDMVTFDYGADSLLGHHFAGRAWAEADYRISFAKNKTHWQCFYTACIKNLYGCLPMWDKMKYYHGQTPDGKNIEFSDAAIECADALWCHFGFMDAWISGDGLTGHVRDASPNRTEVIFASENIYALDWVAGEKMQLNPMDNFVIQKARAKWGDIRITRVGDMAPWHPWNNVKPTIVKSMDVGEEWYHISRFFSHSLAEDQDIRFKPTSTSIYYRTIHSVLNEFDRLFLTPTTVAKTNIVEMTHDFGDD